MPGPDRKDLFIKEDLRFQRREWSVQRVAWGAMALVVLAALAGLFGVGPLSRAEQASGDGTLTVQYQRFARLEAPTVLRVHFGAGATRGGEVRLWLDRKYLEDMNLEQVLPQPQSTRLAGERLVYVFASGGEASGAIFQLKPDRFGRIDGAAGLEGGAASVRFSHLVYP